jgi:hypothetical protein
MLRRTPSKPEFRSVQVCNVYVVFKNVQSGADVVYSNFVSSLRPVLLFKDTYYSRRTLPGAPAGARGGAQAELPAFYERTRWLV